MLGAHRMGSPIVLPVILYMVVLQVTKVTVVDLFETFWQKNLGLIFLTEVSLFFLLTYTNNMRIVKLRSLKRPHFLSRYTNSVRLSGWEEL